MKNRTWNVLALAGALLLTGTALVAGGGTWVSDSGDVHAVHAHGDVAFFGEDDAEVFDLADLNDGETRVFGIGDKALTVQRQGDEATISRDAAGDARQVDVTCLLSSDTCKVLTFDADPEKVMIVVEKNRECVNGVGDCDMTVAVDDLAGGGDRVIIRKVVECDDDGDCADLDVHGGAHAVVEILTDGDTQDADVMVLRSGAAHGGGEFMFHTDEAVAGDPEGNVFIMKSPGHGAMRLAHPDKALLRCSEGDATLTVALDEADDVFLCPKHGQPLERVETPKFIRRIEVKDGSEVHEH